MIFSSRSVRALAALGRNDPPKAIDLLEANRRYEFAIPPLAFNHFYGNMYPVYTFPRPCVPGDASGRGSSRRIQQTTGASWPVSGRPG